MLPPELADAIGRGDADAAAQIYARCAHDAKDDDGRSAAHVAVGHGAVLAALLAARPEAGALTDDAGWTPLVLAVCRGHVPSVRAALCVPPPGGVVQLLKTASRTGQTALHYAAGRGVLPVLDALLASISGAAPGEARALLAQRDSDGATALHRAAVLGRAEAAERLLAEWPGLADEVDRAGRTPHAAALEEGVQNEALLALLAPST